MSDKSKENSLRMASTLENIEDWKNRATVSGSLLGSIKFYEPIQSEIDIDESRISRMSSRVSGMGSSDINVSGRIQSLSIRNTHRNPIKSTTSHNKSRKSFLDRHTLYDVINKMKDTRGFIDTLPKKVLPSYETQASEEEFTIWCTLIRNFVNKHYRNYDLSNLRMIIIGPFGRGNYPKFASVVKTTDEDTVRYHEKFIELINRSLDLEKIRQNARYDYECAAVRDRVLFLADVYQHTTLTHCDDYINNFVNKILEDTKDQDIAILDMRKFPSSTEQNSRLMFGSRAIKHSTDIVPLPVPVQVQVKSRKHEYVFYKEDDNFCAILKMLYTKGFPIDRLYMYEMKKAFVIDYFRILYNVQKSTELSQKIDSFKFFSDELEALLECPNFKNYLSQNKNATEKELKFYKRQQWSADMREFLEHNCPFELSELRTIVLGSVGFEHFCTSTAFVAEDIGKMFRSVPNSVKYFADCLDDINYQVGFEQQATDFYAQHAREHGGFLFLNTCLSVCPNEAVASMCSVEFINQILIEAKKSGHRLAVLDMRLTRYICQSELNPMLEQDRCSLFSGFSYDGDAYKLVNPTESGNAYHRIVRLGNPAFWSGNPDETKYITESINSLMNQGYEINCIYLTKGEYEAAKQQVAQSDDKLEPGKKSTKKENDGESDDSDYREGGSHEDRRNVFNELKKIVSVTKTNEAKMTSEEVLRVLFTYASKYKMSVIKKKYETLGEIVSKYQQSSVCECFYFRANEFVLIDPNTGHLLVFKSANKVRAFESEEFIGIKIQFNQRHTKFGLSQPNVLELIKRIDSFDENDFDATDRSTLMAAFVELSSKTRPDICAEVDLLNRFIAKQPNNPPIDRIKGLISYLASTQNLQFNIKSAELTGFSDASYKGPIVPKLKDPICEDTENMQPNKSQKQTDSANASANSSKKSDTKKLKTKPSTATRITDPSLRQFGHSTRLFGVLVAWHSEKEMEIQSCGKLETTVQGTFAKFELNHSQLIQEIESHLRNRKSQYLNALLNVDHTPEKDNKDKNKKSTSDVSLKTMTKVKNLNDLSAKLDKYPITINYRRSNNNVADIFTRPLHLNQNRKIKEQNADTQDRLRLANLGQKFFTTNGRSTRIAKSEGMTVGPVDLTLNDDRMKSTLIFYHSPMDED